MPHSSHHEEEESSDSTPPFSVSRSTRITAPIYLIIGAMVAIAGAVMAYAGLISNDDKHGTSIQSLEIQTAKHEERIFKLEQAQTNIEVMKNDISWIRKSLENEKGNVFRANPNSH